MCVPKPELGDEGIFVMLSAAKHLVFIECQGQENPCKHIGSAS